MSRRDMRAAIVLIAIAMVVAIAGLASAAHGPTKPATRGIATPAATPVGTGDDLYAAIRPEMRQEIINETDGTLSRYTIRATLLPPGASLPGESQSTGVPTVVGTEELNYVNETGRPLDELQFRLYPNLRQYDTGRMTIDALTVDGRPASAEAPPLYSVPSATPVATPAPEQADLILIRVPLRQSLMPGETTHVSMRFSTSVPIAPPDDSGLFRYHPETEQWSLAHWFPILTGFDPETGWESEPPAAWSDITFSNTALYDVTLSTPENLVLVTPGVELSRTHDGSDLTRRYVTGPARDFPIFAQPDLEVSAVVVDGVIVTSYAPAADRAGADQVLEWAAQALGVYSDLFGPYPYATLDVVAVPDMVGVEFPQLITLGLDFYADPVNAGSRPGAIEFLVAHEVAHQWWYGLVGSNPHRHAFLDEGLAEYSAVIYFERVYGVDVAASHLYNGLVVRYATMLVSGGDQIVDQPTSAFPDALTYYSTDYRKAGLGFAAIRAEIGDAAFFEALASYVASEQFGVAIPSGSAPGVRGRFRQQSRRTLEPVVRRHARPRRHHHGASACHTSGISGGSARRCNADRVRRPRQHCRLQRAGIGGHPSLDNAIAPACHQITARSLASASRDHTRPSRTSVSSSIASWSRCSSAFPCPMKSRRRSSSNASSRVPRGRGACAGNSFRRGSAPSSRRTSTSSSLHGNRSRSSPYTYAQNGATTCCGGSANVTSAAYRVETRSSLRRKGSMSSTP